MSKINWSLLGVFFLFSSLVQAQHATTSHQTFRADKSISKIIVDVSYPFEIEEWVGDMILVETNIKVGNTSRQVMDYFIDKGRYTVIKEDYASSVKLKMKPMSRKEITTHKGSCEENILIKFFIPKHLQISTAGRKAIAAN